LSHDAAEAVVVVVVGRALRAHRQQVVSVAVATALLVVVLECQLRERMIRVPRVARRGAAGAAGQTPSGAVVRVRHPGTVLGDRREVTGLVVAVTPAPSRDEVAVVVVTEGKVALGARLGREPVGRVVVPDGVDFSVRLPTSS
jgi:hypothetical protein